MIIYPRPKVTCLFDSQEDSGEAPSIIMTTHRYMSTFNNMASFQEIINSNIPTLVDFHATWCGPCKTMSPIIDEVKSELGPSVRILKIDVDKNPAVSTKFKIRGVPTFILFKNGEIVWKESGVIPKRTLLSTIQGSAK